MPFIQKRLIDYYIAAAGRAEESNRCAGGVGLTLLTGLRVSPLLLRGLGGSLGTFFHGLGLVLKLVSL